MLSLGVYLRWFLGAFSREHFLVAPLGADRLQQLVGGKLTQRSVGPKLGKSRHQAGRCRRGGVVLVGHWFLMGGWAGNLSMVGMVERELRRSAGSGELRFMMAD